MRSHVKALVAKEWFRAACWGALLAFSTALTLVFVTAGVAWADLVVLKNGREIRGRVLLEGKKETTIQVPYGTLTIPSDDIETIQKESEDQYLRESGKRLLSYKDYDRGLELLRSAYEQNPESAPCRRALIDGLVRTAESKLATRRYTEVQKLLGEATKLSPDSAALQRLSEQLVAIQETRKRLELEAEQAVATEDYAGAFRHYQQLIEGYPEDRAQWRQPYATSAIVLGHMAFEEQQFAAARDFYHVALSEEPLYIDRLQAPLAYAEMQLTVPLLQKGDFKGARSRLKRTLDLIPGNPALVYHLALATEGSGDLSEAADLYASIAGDEATHSDERYLVELRTLAENQLRKADGVPTADPRWRELAGAKGTRETRHFLIAHQNGPQAAELERYLEHHLRRLVRKWFPAGNSPEWRGKIRVVLHRDKATFHAQINPPSWAQAVAVNERRYGLLTSQAVHFHAEDPEFLSATLPHELAHIVLPHRVGVGLTIPAWLDEGVATGEEPAYKQAYYARVVAEAHATNGLLSVDAMLKSRGYPDAEQITLFYAQSNSLIRFLRGRLSKTRFFGLLRLLSIYPDPNRALKEGSSFGSSQELEGAWRRWVASGGSR